MSLGVSQISLIMQTKRKADIEAQLSALALDRMSVTRESTEASTEYSKALNAKSLVWSNDGGTTTSAVSYDLFNNQTSGYMLTNNNGAIVISPSDKAMMAMLEKSGNGYKLKDETTAIKAAVTAVGYSPNDDEVKSIVNASNSTKDITGAVSFNAAYKTSEVFKELNSSSSYSLTNDPGKWNKSGAKFATCTFDGKGTGSSNYVFCQDAKKITDAELRKELGGAVDDITTNVGKALVAVLSDTDHFGTAYSSVSSKITIAINAAIAATRQYYQNDYDARTTASKKESGSESLWWQNITKSKVNNISNDKNTQFDDGVKGQGMSTSYSKNGMYIDYYGSDNEAFIDTTDVAKTFLTFFNYYCKNLNNTSGTDYANATNMSAYENLGLTDKNGNSTDTNLDTALTNSMPTDAKCTVAGTTASSYTSSVSNAIQVYYEMYERMSSNSFVVSDSVDNDAYLQQQILNGNLVVKKISSSEVETVGGTDSPLSQEESDTAIAKAKAEYDKKKSEIEEKEQVYDVKQNQLDTELSSLNTMIESTQKMVDKDVEAFKLFNNA